MNYLSVCSGVEAASVAWHEMGWNPIAFSEIEKFPSAVLAHHYPNVPNLGDMTKYKEWNLNAPIDLLVGGTPCQSFSVAGLRKGLEDPRGNLCLTYVGILDKFRPKWCVWENVPGVLSSGNGRDFGSFLGALVELGYGFAYRVLDAQNFGVAQRRRRVFVVGCLGDWESAAKVLFESESLSGDIKKSRAEREEITSNAQARSGSGKSVIPTLMANAGTKLWLGNQEAFSGDYHILQPKVYENHPTDSRIKETDVSPTVTRRWGTGGGNVPLTQTFCLQGAGVTSQNAKGEGFKEAQAYTLNRVDVHGVAIGVDTYNGTIQGDIAATMTADMAGPTHSGPKIMQIVAPTLTTNDPSRSPRATEVTNQIAAVYEVSLAVRRLTPIECERLQGFPDNYTNIKDKCPDGPRYKAMGNSMAVPCMRWIGERIKMVENSND